MHPSRPALETKDHTPPFSAPEESEIMPSSLVELRAGLHLREKRRVRPQWDPRASQIPPVVATRNSLTCSPTSAPPVPRAPKCWFVDYHYYCGSQMMQEHHSPDNGSTLCRYQTISRRQNIAQVY